MDKNEKDLASNEIKEVLITPNVKVTPVPAIIRHPKVKWEITMTDANEYGLTVLQSAFPYLIAIFLCFFVSDYMADWSIDIDDEEEQTKEILNLVSSLFWLTGFILSIGLTIGLAYKVVGDAMLFSIKAYSNSQQK